MYYSVSKKLYDMYRYVICIMSVTYCNFIDIVDIDGGSLSSIQITFSIMKHPFWGPHILQNPQMKWID